MIRDTARDFLAVRSDSAAVRRVVDAVADAARDGHDTALWREMAGELGWCGIALPEAAGGAGLGAVELALLMEQMGQRLACVPYWSAICLAAPALAGSLSPRPPRRGWRGWRRARRVPRWPCPAGWRPARMARSMPMR
ncbi:acyl-CoA dehydrogenase family protein [Cupriavidus basilensis]